MYSLLEDMELCRINNERGVALKDLIALSTMCGCGLDMVPLPGDITKAELRSIIFDIYAISTRLNKPLGLRILPIPETSRNQIAYTKMNSDADFVSNTKILKLASNLVSTFSDEFTYLKN